MSDSLTIIEKNKNNPSVMSCRATGAIQIGLDKNVINNKGVRNKQNKNFGEVIKIYNILIQRLAVELRVSVEDREKFRQSVLRTAEELVRARLPSKVVRDYKPRQEDIIDYLVSPEGFGPWIAVDALTRPVIFKMAPKAYQALLYWLRGNELPPYLSIPKKSEVVDREVQDAVAAKTTMAQARRLLRAADRRGIRSGPKL